MKATDVILRDHRAAEELFAKFKAASGDERDAVAKDIFKALTAHELMEDTHFYPALKERLGDDATLQELEQEQTSLKMDVTGDHAIDMLPGDHTERITEMMEKVLAHAKKEEVELLPKAESALGAEELERIGVEMEPDSAVAKSKE
jgi:hemerythrin superfamily protein